ncbi:hypothetical protein EVAR_46131_1 [Eumeta japonica]|uniref:Uncharacterized protein n=1 Tax=Eumeta variegata TaxID=151549 RepID=A0A4C1XSU3_EUMVA|nr:hypothetical protein EVAR_46131_1 [Eumeta japonica]
MTIIGDVVSRFAYRDERLPGRAFYGAGNVRAGCDLIATSDKRIDSRIIRSFTFVTTMMSLALPAFDLSKSALDEEVRGGFHAAYYYMLQANRPTWTSLHTLACLLLTHRITQRRKRRLAAPLARGGAREPTPPGRIGDASFKIIASSLLNSASGSR